jgi:hypothetical protein
VCYQDIPRLDSVVDGYPEEAQTVLIRHLINQEYGCGVWSSAWSQILSETVICALGSLPLTKPLELQRHSKEFRRKDKPLTNCNKPNMPNCTRT